MLIGSGSTGNYLSALCQTALELEVKPKEDFKRLTLANGSEVHVQGCVQFCLSLWELQDQNSHSGFPESS